MTQYGSRYGGQKPTAAEWNKLIWDKVVKQALTFRVSTTVIDEDPDLSVSLGIGTWDVRCMLFLTAAAASVNLKTQWMFTGTWSNPLRACIGPGASNVAAPSAITPMKMTAQSANSDSVYGLSNSAAYTVVTEESSLVVVTVAGVMSVGWAQGTSSVSQARVQQGSYLQALQIDD